MGTHGTEHSCCVQTARKAHEVPTTHDPRPSKQTATTAVGQISTYS